MVTLLTKCQYELGSGIGNTWGNWDEIFCNLDLIISETKLADFDIKTITIHERKAS